MKRAILVFGPESSGTRLMTSILMNAGCIGSSDHYQWWDENDFEEGDDLVVWRRSFPHGRERRWPDVGAMALRLDKAGYRIQVLVMARDVHSMSSSQARQGYAESYQAAVKAIGSAYASIFEQSCGGLATLDNSPVVITYESLVQRPSEVQAWLAEMLKLPARPYVRITDGNEKYYGEDYYHVLREGGFPPPLE